MSEEQKPPEERIVLQQGSLPCGCHKTEYADKGPDDIEPCLGHAFVGVANAFGHGAVLLKKIGERMVMDTQQAAMNEIADSLGDLGPKGVVGP